MELIEGKGYDAEREVNAAQVPYKEDYYNITL